MKHALFFALGLASLQLNAQNPLSDSLGFEKNQTPDTSIQVVELTGDWLIGTPSKNVFPTAHSGTRAAVTDTATNKYSPNTVSQMTLLFKFSKYTYNNINISFWNELYMNEGSDSAKVDLSFNKGVDWLSTNQANEYLLCSGGFVYCSFDSSGTITQNIPNWTKYTIDIRTMVLVRLEDCDSTKFEFHHLDSLLLRFTFYSNTSSPTDGGWIIDDINMLADIAGGLTNQIYTDVNLIRLVPNPSAGQLVRLETTSPNLQIKSWTVEDVQGKNKLSSLSSTEINTQSLPQGLYLVRIETSQGWVGKKLVVE